MQPTKEYINSLLPRIAKAEKTLWDWYGHTDCPEELANKSVEELLNLLETANREKPPSSQPHSELFRALNLLKMKLGLK